MTSCIRDCTATTRLQLGSFPGRGRSDLVFSIYESGGTEKTTQCLQSMGESSNVHGSTGFVSLHLVKYVGVSHLQVLSDRFGKL